MAEEQARKRNLDVHFEVMDVCALPREGKTYDLIVDSYCLQCIVTDEDRQRARVREERVEHAASGVAYTGYGEDGLIDLRSGIVLQRLPGDPRDCEDATQIGGEWYLPNRRHLEAQQLKREVECAGFDVLAQRGRLGENLICALRGSDVALARPFAR
jgi:hypothetical protein